MGEAWAAESVCASPHQPGLPAALSQLQIPRALPEPHTQPPSQASVQPTMLIHSLHVAHLFRVRCSQDAHSPLPNAEVGGRFRGRRTGNQ